MTTFRSPIGSSVYFVLLFIDFPSFSPITCAIDANYVATVCKPDRQNTFTDTSHAVIPIFFSTMGNVFRDNTVGIKKSLLCGQKRNAMFGLVFLVLFFIPFKGCFSHVHIIPWLYAAMAILKYGNIYGSAMPYIQSPNEEFTDTAYPARYPTCKSPKARKRDENSPISCRVQWNDLDPFHFPDFLLLSSLHSIWQFSALVFPPSCQGVMWSPSISSISKCSLHTGQMPFCRS